MTKSDNVSPFPQDRVKPSIGDLCLQAETPEEALVLVAAAYPDMTNSEIRAAIQAEADKMMAEGGGKDNARSR